MRKIAGLVALLAVTGCAPGLLRPPPIAFTAPNGGTGFSIRCGSAHLEQCYNQAASVCPTGYTVLEKQASPNGVLFPSGNSTMMAHGPTTLLVQCKA